MPRQLAHVMVCQWGSDEAMSSGEVMLVWHHGWNAPGVCVCGGGLGLSVQGLSAVEKWHVQGDDFKRKELLPPLGCWQRVTFVVPILSLTQLINSRSNFLNQVSQEVSLDLFFGGFILGLWGNIFNTGSQPSVRASRSPCFMACPLFQGCCVRDSLVHENADLWPLFDSAVYRGWSLIPPLFLSADVPFTGTVSLRHISSVLNATSLNLHKCHKS